MTSDRAQRTPAPSPARQWLVLAVLLLPVLIISIDNTVLGFAVPELSEDLAPTSSQLLWIVDVYAFVLAGFLIPMGTFGDRIGRRRLLVWGAAGFGVASALAAFSTTPEMLIGARALLGFAGATLMPSTLSIIRNVFDDPDRRRVAIGIWTAGFAVGAVIGPVVGGWLLEHAWWGSVFLINLPVMALLLVLAPLVVPESKDPAPGRYDLVSSGLALLTMLPLVYAVKKVAESGPDLILAVVAGVGLLSGVAFVMRQRRLPDPMLDVGLFAHRTFSVAVGTNLLGNFALIGALFFTAQYLQIVLGLGPLAAGAHLAPGMAMSMTASIGAAILLRRGVGVPRLLGSGLTIVGLGYLSMLSLGVTEGASQMMAAMVLVGLGVGAATSVGANLVMAAVPAERAGAASAVSETAFELGAALGTAVLGTVVTAVYRRGIVLPGELTPQQREAAHETLGAAAHLAETLPAGVADAVLEGAKGAFTSGVHAAAVVGAGLMLLAAATATWLLRRSRTAAARG